MSHLLTTIRNAVSPSALSRWRDERRRRGYRHNRPQGLVRLEGRVAGWLFARGMLPGRAGPWSWR